MFDEDGDLDGPTNDGKSIAWRNMNFCVTENKDGPEFTHKDKLMDANQRKPDDPNYDPSTLYIPEKVWKNFGPGMHRYWESKHRNFDKIVFYRYGQWFIVYY